MTDLSKHTLAELEAEIERRKSEPDYAAWEPKLLAFGKVLNWPNMPWTDSANQRYIRALIAAHNTPLAGEEWMEYQPSKDGVGPGGVSMETYEIEYSAEIKSGGWCKVPIGGPDWFMGKLYRYRPKQTDDWIPWTGGECPVSGNTLVDAKLRNGIVRRGSACVWYWLYDGPEESQVIAYRVVKEP